MLREIRGRLVAAPDRAIGDTLAGDHPAGSTVLSMNDTIEFDADGGLLQLGTKEIVYTTIDDDESTIYLDVPTEDDAFDGDDVIRLPVVMEKQVQVRLATDSGSAPVDVRVPFHMRSAVADAIRDSADEPYAFVRTFDGEHWELYDIRGIERRVDARDLDGPIDGGLIDPETEIPTASVPEDLREAIFGSVADYVLEYAVGGSETVEPTTGWSTASPTRTPGTFIWVRTRVIKQNGDETLSSAALLTGNAGAAGDDGDPGASGRGIASTTVTYQVGSSATSAPTGTWQSSPPATTTGQYLWTRTVTTFTDASAPTTAYSVSAHGATGNPGVGVSSTAVTYQVSSSGTTAPTGTWQTTPQATTTGQFLWTRTITTYSNSTTTTGYAVSAHGAPGTAGVSISSVTPYFQQTATSASAPAQPTVSPPPSPWVATEPAYAADTALWRTERIVYSNGTFAYTTVTKVSAYTAAATAMTTANGKNANSSSTAELTSPTGRTVGDLHYVLGTGPTSGSVIKIQRLTAGSPNVWVDQPADVATLAGANVAWLNAIIISANTLLAEIVSAETITGAVVRNSSGAQRVEMNEDGFESIGLPGQLMDSFSVDSPTDSGTLLGIAIGPSGSIIVAEGRGTNFSEVRRYSSSGALEFRLTRPSGPGAAQLFDACVDSSGNLYLLESSGIKKFTSAGVAVAGFSSSVSGTTEAQIDIDSSGVLYVSDSTPRVVRVNGSTGATISQWTIPDPARSLHVTSSYVFVYTMSTDGATRKISRYSLTGTGGTTWDVNALNDTGLKGLATDAAGDLYTTRTVGSGSAAGTSDLIKLNPSTGTLIATYLVSSAAEAAYPSCLAIVGDQALMYGNRTLRKHALTAQTSFEIDGDSGRVKSTQLEVTGGLDADIIRARMIAGAEVRIPGLITAKDRTDLTPYATGVTVTNGFDIRRDGKWREIRFGVTRNLPVGSTDISTALEERDRPTLNVFANCYLASGNIGVAFIRPNGTIAINNMSGTSRSGQHQGSLTYTVE